MKLAMARALAFTIAIVAAAAACQAPAVTPSPPPPTPTPTATATPAPTRTPSGEARELVASRQDLKPGRYTRNGFVPRVTFEVNGGWRAVQVLPGFFDIQRDVRSPDVIAVQWARPDGIYETPDRLVAPGTAQAAVEALGRNPELVVLETSESRMDGRTGSQVTVENPSTGEADVGVMHLPVGALLLSPGRRLWIALFDRPEGLVAIMVGGSVAKWDEALLAAEPVLESVTIGR